MQTDSTVKAEIPVWSLSFARLFISIKEERLDQSACFLSVFILSLPIRDWSTDFLVICSNNWLIIVNLNIAYLTWIDHLKTESLRPYFVDFYTFFFLLLSSSFGNSKIILEGHHVLSGFFALKTFWQIKECNCLWLYKFYSIYFKWGCVCITHQLRWIISIKNFLVIIDLTKNFSCSEWSVILCESTVE